MPHADPARAQAPRPTGPAASRTGARSLHRLLAAIVLGLMLSALTGCGGYRLQGKMIEVRGSPPRVFLVGGDDERFKQPGLRFATIELTIDPKSIRPNHMELVHVNDDGTFSIPVKEAGAGFLEYDVTILARAEGHRPVITTMKLPSSFKRVLIALPPGRDDYKPEVDIMEETLRYDSDLRKQ